MAEHQNLHTTSQLGMALLHYKWDLAPVEDIERMTPKHETISLATEWGQRER